MQQVSFYDINKTPDRARHCATLRDTYRFPGIPPVPGAVDPKTRRMPDASAPGPLGANRSDGTAKNQMYKDEGPLTLDRSKTVDEEISGHVIDFLDRNDPKKTGKPFFVLVQSGAHARYHHAVAEV